MPLKIVTPCLVLFLALVVVGCTSQKTTPTPSTKESPEISAEKPSEKETVVKDQILVLLEGRVQPDEMLIDLKAYEATKKGPTSRSQNQWIIAFNTQLIQPEEMLKKIKAYETVIKAEFLPVQTKL